MISIKICFQLIIASSYFISLGFGNEFFNCLENSVFSSERHCSLFLNKWDRLPVQIKPTKYKLTIQPFIHLPNETDFYYKGSVSIEFKSDISHKHILLNGGPNLDFKNAKLKIYNSDRKTIKVQSVVYIKPRKWILIKLDEKLPANAKHYIHFIKYTSKFSKVPHGLYTFSFTINKVKKYGANTLLSPFYARLVLPCFDDPVFVATIQFKVIRRKEFVSQSIMPIHQTRDLGEDWFVDIYEWTPPMQIYQFTFSVNTFNYITEYTKTGHKVRVWAPQEKLSSCKFSLGKIKMALEFYEKYFDSPYTFSKLDIVATTNMPPYETGSSTYGLLILMDSILFINEETILPRWKQIYIETLNHETAHQWIGNTLKMEWFDTLWVIEGLVGYMEKKIDAYQNQYSNKLTTALHQTLTGLLIDDSEIYHKLSVYPYTTKHVEYYFDDLIFTKGFALFQMIEGVVGEVNFQYALQKLLNEVNLEPMTSNSIWRYFDRVLETKDISISIEYLMKRWQSKRGFPVVQAKIQDGNRLVLSQKGNQPDNKKFIWPIPITYLMKNGEERTDHTSVYWMHDRSETIQLDNTMDDDDWFILNQDQIGFIRVNYEMSNWILLIHQLQSDHLKIPAVARLQIFDDIFQFYCNGEIPGANNIFDVLSYLEKEDEYIIWKYSTPIIDFLVSFFENRDSYEHFTKFMNQIIRHLLRKIQWHRMTSRSLTSQMRDQLMMFFACRFKNPYCQERTDEYFGYWLKDNYFIAPLHLYGPILCTGIQNGDRSVWYRVLKSLYKPKMSFDQKILISQSLSCSRDPDILNTYWDMMLTNGTKFKTLYSALLASLAKNIHSRSIFENRICSSTVNITKNAFEFAATLAAMNNFMLPSDCEAVKQLHLVRFKRSSGDNLEIETSIINDETRRSLYDKHLFSLEEWLKKYYGEKSI